MFINICHGTVNKNVATMKILEVFSRISVVKMSLHATTYNTPDGGLEAENTK
jgi:hypothetical protein